LDRTAELDPASLAATAGVDLRLHDPDRAVQFLGDRFGFLRRVRDVAARHRHVVTPEQCLGLILVDVHRPSLTRDAPTDRACAPTGALSNVGSIRLKSAGASGTLSEAGTKER